MKAIGIITEYNPLHTGHIHHINMAKSTNDADCLICVMSSDFVQRGEPAIFNKYARTLSALKSGVNLVVELPVRFSTASSEGFASSAVAVLDALNASSLVFGSESGDTDTLMQIAKYLANEEPSFKTFLQEELKKGNSYPAARMTAISKTLGEDVSRLLSGPNNILGIEYIKAISKNNYNITPVTIKRTSDNFNSDQLEDIPSASAVRKAIADNTFPPEYICENLLKNFDADNYTPIFMEDFAHIINYKLADTIYSKQALTDYSDINVPLANKLANNFTGNDTIEEYLQKCKTKDFTYVRIQRALLHILLNISPLKTYEPEYIRVLGFDDIGQAYLNQIKKDLSVPIITKPAHAFKKLDTTALHLFEEDIYASNVYNQVVYRKYGYKSSNDYTKGPVRIVN